MKTYEDVSKECGKVAAARDWCWCLGRVGDDVLAIYRGVETARWKPSNELIVTIPENARTYFTRATWNRRLYWYTGCEMVSRKKTISQGLFFGVKFGGEVHEVVSQLHIDLTTKKACPLDPVRKKKILRGKAREAFDYAMKVMKVSYATHHLMPTVTRSWEESKVLRTPKQLAQLLADEKVGEIATALKHLYYGPNEDVAYQFVRQARAEIYALAGATV